MDVYNLVSFGGLWGFVLLAWLLSADRGKVNWRLLGWGIGLQLVFALLLFLFPGGTAVFLAVNKGVVALMNAAAEGSRFVFGRLALPPGATGPAGEPSLGFILATQALPTIVFFSALVAVLYHYGVLPWLIRQFARLFTKLMRLSGAESLVAAGNIFVGVEAALTVKPHLKDMTRSELCTVLAVGMATVASNVLALYVFTLQQQFPNIAGHLVSASFLSAPAALVMAKLLMPESGAPKTLGVDVAPHYEKDDTVMEAVIKGSNDGVRLIVGIVALLLAVLGLVAVVDMVLVGIGGLAHQWFGVSVDLSLRTLLGYVFYPFTLMMGVPPADAGAVARLVGERAVLTEVVAYQDLAVLLKDGALTHPRSAVVATYALCGFAHVASLAIFTGGVAALAPERTKDLARVAWRALLADTLACLMTACVAGTFYHQGSVLFAP